MSESFDRSKLIEEKIRQREETAVVSLAVIREVVRDFLVREKGYSDGDIEPDKEFEIFLGSEAIRTSVDYILNVEGRRFMAIKCSPGALESRDRHLVSFARVVDSYQIPFAVVTDGVRARILNTLSGKLAAEGLEAIPKKTEAVDAVRSIEFLPYPAERIEREKRILLAFDSIGCTEESGE